MKQVAKVCLIAAILIVAACDNSTPRESQPPVSDAAVKAAIEKGIEANSMLKLSASLLGGKISQFGPVFIDGNKGTARFVFAGGRYEGQAALAKATDGHWHVTYISMPNVQQGSAACNVLVE